MTLNKRDKKNKLEVGGWNTNEWQIYLFMEL
jgi:hypothetical protein